MYDLLITSIGNQFIRTGGMLNDKMTSTYLKFIWSIKEQNILKTSKPHKIK